LRFATGSVRTYRTPLKRFLNNFMDDWSEKADEQLADDEAAFNRTIARARDELGTAAFRVTNADGTPSESVVNRAIFDAIYLSRVVYYPRKSEHLCT
jgi:Lon protease-like protein